jgi:hypothetical protein
MVQSSRLVRRIVEFGFPLFGAVLVVFAVSVANDQGSRLGIALAGTTLMLVSSFHLHQGMLPNGRQYHQLRGEVDRLIGAVRRLNASAAVATTSPVAAENFAAARSELNEMASRISAVVAETHGVPNDRVPV